MYKFVKTSAKLCKDSCSDLWQSNHVFLLDSVADLENKPESFSSHAPNLSFPSDEALWRRKSAEGRRARPKELKERRKKQNRSTDQAIV